ncbi:hypothetical protein MMK73_003089 [Providencia rettgeri]|nr:hypothetical protein [Providencia rettgeri]
MYVIPQGVMDKTSANSEVQIMIIEPRGIFNTGDEESTRTAENDVWI